ncbi:MAG: hypothetical protein J0H31_09570 [Alphaproteobacteria bacterium]|nr:hypothetical protein [Alphaproteobacteria bacterium]
MVTTTGSFLSADCCFWQPVAESAAPAQASDNKVLERKRRRSGDDGKVDDLAVLLMVSLSPWDPVPTAARRGSNEINRSAGKENHFQGAYRRAG